MVFNVCVGVVVGMGRHLHQRGASVILELTFGTRPVEVGHEVMSLLHVDAQLALVQVRHETTVPLRRRERTNERRGFECQIRSIHVLWCARKRTTLLAAHREVM